MKVSAVSVTNIAVKVVDEKGGALRSVRTTVVFNAGGKRIKREGVTDANGLFSAQGEVPAKVGVGGEKEGYYRSIDNFVITLGENCAGSRAYTLTLRAISDPQEGNKSGYSGNIPKMNESLGFDVVAGDWVAPYGKGMVSDFVFTCFNDTTNKVASYILAFSNPGDGIIEYPRNKKGQSIFWWPHTAPLDGYIPELKKKKNYSGQYGDDSVLPEYTEVSSETYEMLHIFRVRTQYDDEGNITSAYYGKIPSAIGITWNNQLGFGYWLNTDPHSRSMESTDPYSP